MFQNTIFQDSMNVKYVSPVIYISTLKMFLNTIFQDSMNVKYLSPVVYIYTSDVSKYNLLG